MHNNKIAIGSPWVDRITTIECIVDINMEITLHTKLEQTVSLI
jgi:hypothetical protein